MRNTPSGVRMSPRRILSPTGCCPSATRYVRTGEPRWYSVSFLCDLSTTMLSAVSGSLARVTGTAADLGATRVLSAEPSTTNAAAPTRRVSGIVAVQPGYSVQQDRWPDQSGLPSDVSAGGTAAGLLGRNLENGPAPVKMAVRV